MFLFVCLPLIPYFLYICYLLCVFFHFLHPSSLSQVYQCPLCKKTFPKRPDLHINRTLREITEQFRSTRGGGGGVKEKRGGRTRGGIHHNLFDELKKKLPRHHSKTSVTPTCEAQFKTGRSICQN